MHEPRPDEALSSPADLRRARWTFPLCFLAALVEGYDMQAAGVVAPMMARHFSLHVGSITDLDDNLTWVLSISTLGLLLGAGLGGRLADHIGRKWVLTSSMLVFSLFTFGSAYAANYEWLLVMRFFTGIGLGGAIPNIIALVAESSTPATKAARVTAVTGAMPAGGALASLLVYTGGASFDWRLAFIVGGLLPLAVFFLMIAGLRETMDRTSAAASGKLAGTGQILFSEGRAPSTLLLWISFLLTLIVLYLLQNWLAVLLNTRGFAPSQATLATLAFNIGGAAGGWGFSALLRRLPRNTLLLLCYLSMMLSVGALALAPRDPLIIYAASFGCGCFVIGTQFILYGMAPAFYRPSIRGTGVGWAVAVGRIGSFVGPLLPGIVGQPRVLKLLLPVILLGGTAAQLLSRRPDDA